MPESHPYSVVVIDPHPSLDEGTAKIYQFDVDQPFPQFGIPLGDDQQVPASEFDLGTVYNITYVRTPTLARILDYEQLPERFNSYALADQTRITHRMIMLRINQQLGNDLDQDIPFPIDLNLIERFLRGS